MFDVKLAFANEDEDAEVEFRTGTPQREPECKSIKSCHFFYLLEL